MIKLQNYLTSCSKSIFINIMTYQMLKKNRPKYDLVNLMFDKCYCKKGIKKN